MEEKKDHAHQNGQVCNCCGHHPYLILRWILGIVIIVLVFTFGMKIGELKASLEYGYGMGYSMQECAADITVCPMPTCRYRGRHR